MNIWYSHIYLVSWVSSIINCFIDGSMAVWSGVHGYNAIIVHCVLSCVFVCGWVVEYHPWSLASNSAAWEQSSRSPLHTRSKALSWLTQSQVHAVMLLFKWINVSSHLKLLLDWHLRSINCWCISLIELRWVMHYRVHIHQLLTAVYRLALVFQHDTPGQIHILILLHRPSLAQGAAEIPWWMHLFHYTGHSRGGLLILLLLLLDL